MADQLVVSQMPSNLEEDKPTNKEIATIQQTGASLEKTDDDLSSSDDEEDVGQSSLLKIMIEKHEAIEKTVSLIKKEINPVTIDKTTVPSSTSPGNVINKPKDDVTSQQATKNQAAPPKTTKEDPSQVKEEFDQLNNLLSDNKVQNMIRGVGTDTQLVIDKALRAINESKSTQDKRTALSLGLRKLQMNLSTKANVDRDPSYNMAMSLVGLTGRRR